MATSEINQSGSTIDHNALSDAVAVEAEQLWEELPDRCRHCPQAEQLVLKAASKLAECTRTIAAGQQAIIDSAFSLPHSSRVTVPDKAREYVEDQSAKIKLAHGRYNQITGSVQALLALCLEGPMRVNVRAPDRTIQSVSKCNHPQILARPLAPED